MTSKRSRNCRALISEYVGAGLHLIDENAAKPISQIAKETRMSGHTVRRWLEQDHYDVWFRWWPSFDAIHEAVLRERTEDGAKPANIVSTLPEPDLVAIAEEDEPMQLRGQSHGMRRRNGRWRHI